MAAIVACASGCGRVAFDPVSRASDGATSGDSPGQAIPSGAKIWLRMETDPTTLGGSRNDFYVQGVVDDALYYTRALSAAEIQQLATP